MPRLRNAALLAALSRSLVAAEDHATKKGEAVFTPADIKWQDGPPSLPKGAKIALLEGDPSKKGHFVMRVKMPDGYRIAPHTHLKPERVTVISGTLSLGMGGTFDKNKAKEMPAGSYGHMPAGMKHYGWVKGETVIQVNGEGPWSIEYVSPREGPRKK
jgi:quercetin dioxygenase-like cupin family protein